MNSRVKSFGHALAGLAHLLRTQPNARIHLIATLVTLGLGFGLHVSRADWCWLVAAIVAVWAAEAFNTALELLGDALTRESHPLIGKAKDCAAAAVLIVSVGAVAIGALVFVPYLIRVFAN